MIDTIQIQRPNQFFDEYRIGIKVGNVVYDCELNQVKNDMTKMQLALEIVEQFIREDKQRKEREQAELEDS